ncbi:hypothetical protein LEP1GSC171_3708 [Leptospira santarosai str. HAI1380]|uniref:Uncharacterized protein n=1 Tax=Leptospira santarosai serovar Arenal str. MAVJ 401 TaxID=1049976 RepID=M6JQN5_9LEPT|nr:hypothetical protein LEP1GSC169_3823 [Leptospira santarosai str. HAI1349]EMN21923.1 hypothetical protein LEP1GSC063_3570 [Leptospira santarosai serovar Arenal str. MAVJ 401]EMO13901.1 hypothetical protein LEP1GSC165_3620 [Leptospira santarosai str. CBC523]EMO22610.1 hypothetical protein LEP1GSC168_1878 [Leptospira santarosai str. HAI134]EMO33542.1 hypothetical protein LEP1GSC175_2529 [Leptospira santarosai str. HAI821]EMP01343.1 hypothetical protein LEP1GSC171_3708 [Leptospira santarosai st
MATQSPFLKKIQVNAALISFCLIFRHFSFFKIEKILNKSFKNRQILSKLKSNLLKIPQTSFTGNRSF